MNTRLTLAALATAIVLTGSVVACGGAASDDSSPSDNVDQGPEQDIVTTKNQLQGSWKIDDASKNLSSDVSYEFNANGSFSRAVTRILNGVLLSGAPRPTDQQTGKYTVDAAKHIVTLNIKTPSEMTETCSYTYTASPNTHPTLKLTGIAPQGSHIAFPTITYDQIVAVGAEGSTCGGFVGLQCQAGLICKAAASCCDMAGICARP